LNFFAVFAVMGKRTADKRGYDEQCNLVVQVPRYAALFNLMEERK